MGGVINIILKTGLTAPGNVVQADAGSWNLLEAKAATGGLYKGFDWYVGGAASTRDNYASRAARPSSTRRGRATQPAPSATRSTRPAASRARCSDGIYNAGFRGSSANLFAFDTRYNYSFDTSYLAKTRDGQGNVYFQAYFVTDVDDLNNSPLSAAQCAGITHDGSQPPPARHSSARVSSRATSCSPATSSCSASTGSAAGCVRPLSPGGAAVTQLSPQDNNQTDNVFAVYLEDLQSFFDDKLIVRGGVPDLGHHGARLDALCADPGHRHQSLPGHDLLGGPDLRLHRLVWPAEPAPRAAFVRRPPPRSAPTSRPRRSAPPSSATGTGAGDQPAMGGRRDGNVERRPLRHGGVPEHHLQPHRAAHRVLDRPRRAGPDQQPGQPRGPPNSRCRPICSSRSTGGRPSTACSGTVRQRLLQLAR